MEKSIACGMSRAGQKPDKNRPYRISRRFPYPIGVSNPIPFFHNSTFFTIQRQYPLASPRIAILCAPLLWLF